MQRKLLLGIAVAVFLLSSVASTDAATVSLDIAPLEYDRNDYCAETCIQEALRYLGADVSQDSINEAGGQQHTVGLESGQQITTALNNLGVKFTSWNLTSPVYDEYIAMIKEKLDKQYPVLVGVKINPTTHPDWINDHFLLIIGYTDDSFIYNSPSSRDVRTFDQFKNGDADGSGYTLINPYNTFFGVAFGEVANNDTNTPNNSEGSGGGGGCDGGFGLCAALGAAVLLRKQCLRKK